MRKIYNYLFKIKPETGETLPIGKIALFFILLIISLLLLSSVIIFPIYQEYFDPLILILIFTFFKTKLFITNKKLIFLAIYLSLFLLIANIYYYIIIKL